VNVAVAMYRYTTDVIASCAFGINGNSLKDPNVVFWFFLRKTLYFTVRKGLAGLMGIFSPALTSLLKLKLMNDDTTNYLRKTVWSTVEYR